MPKKRRTRKKRKISKWLTEREAQVLYFVRTFQYENRYSPSTRDISKIFMFPQTNASYYVQRLVAKGYLERSGHPHSPHKQILFPKGTEFAWGDEETFPREVFLTP